MEKSHAHNNKYRKYLALNVTAKMLKQMHNLERFWQNIID